jgi:hypothetical protein
MGTPLVAARTRPETVSVLSRVSTTVTFESAELVAAQAAGSARPCAAHHKMSNGKRRCLGIQLVVFIKLLVLPAVIKTALIDRIMAGQNHLLNLPMKCKSRALESAHRQDSARL